MPSRIVGAGPRPRRSTASSGSTWRPAAPRRVTYLALANESDPMGDGVPDHVEKEFRSYLPCGILAHGFARARCSGCGHEFLVGLIYEVFPLICPTCQEPLTFIAFLTDPEPIPKGHFDQSWGA